MPLKEKPNKVGQHLLIIGFVWPEPNSSAAGSRMIQLIKLFKDFGYEITFACAAKTTSNTFNLNQLGIDTADIKLNDSSFDTFIATLNPDVVIYDRFMIEEQYGWRVCEQCPQTLRILDTEDFHGLRKARALALKANTKVLPEHLYNDTTKREIAALLRCDLSLVISEAEMKILSSTFKIDERLLHYLPFLVSPISKAEQQHLPEFNERSHFITVGNFLHPPNYDAVLHLKHQIWPLVKSKLKKAELHIYGAYGSEKVQQLHNPEEGFIIKGYTEDINEVMKKAKVCLAPLRFGAGLKGKIIDAIQNGTPCAMTTIAAEGMFGDLPPNGCVEDDVLQFAQQCVTLYESEALWNRCQLNGFKIISERFNKRHFHQALHHRLEALQQNIDTHRENNFIGQVLQHQSLQSSRYLSKWIEEKNKR